jgi:hypothetical protein
VECNIAVGSSTPGRRRVVDCRIDDGWYGPATVLAILEYPLRSPFDLAVGHLARVVHAASVSEALHHAATADIAVTVLSAGVASLETSEDVRALVTHP